MPISTRPVTDTDFVVEVTDIDLSQEQDDATIAELRVALNEHSILVFHGQRLTSEQQIAFSRRTGG